MPVIPAIWEVEVGGSWLMASPGKRRRPYMKNKPKAKRAGDVFQVIEHIPIKCKALSSNPSTTE
jgi:hypothetical protein